jgi:hypothetical protein
MKVLNFYNDFYFFLFCCFSNFLMKFFQFFFRRFFKIVFNDSLFSILYRHKILRQHIKNVHHLDPQTGEDLTKELKSFCEYCQSEFSNPRSLSAHISILHQSNFTCEICQVWDQNYNTVISITVLAGVCMPLFSQHLYLIRLLKTTHLIEFLGSSN